MRIVSNMMCRVNRRSICELTLLAALLVPFAWPQSSVLTPHRLSAGDVEREIFVDADSYRLWYEAYQLYGCGLDELTGAQRSAVERSFRCAAIVDKYAVVGAGSLTDEECELVIELLPKRCARLDEYPAYLEILRFCRNRLEAPPSAIKNGAVSHSLD
jgi:hypothetical protein